MKTFLIKSCSTRYNTVYEPEPGISTDLTDVDPINILARGFQFGNAFDDFEEKFAIESSLDSNKGDNKEKMQTKTHEHWDKPNWSVPGLSANHCKSTNLEDRDTFLRQPLVSGGSEASNMRMDQLVPINMGYQKCISEQYQENKPNHFEPNTESNYHRSDSDERSRMERLQGRNWLNSQHNMAGNNN